MTSRRNASVRRFTADLRLWRHSGIGRYLRNVVPLLLPQLKYDRMRILGRRDHLDGEPWLADSRIQFVEETAGLHSLAEQSIPLRHRFGRKDLLWVPHFNVPLMYRGPLIVTMHDIAPLALPQILNSALKRRFARLAIEHAAQADAILCDSLFTYSELQRFLNTPASRLQVIHPGLDANWPTHAAPHLEADGVPYVLFVGNVKPNKNLSLLLAAFRKIADRVDFRLLLAGRTHGLGTSDKAVLLDAEAFGDRVRFTGEITDQELHTLYAGARALCLPSRYEGFGLPLLEAMALDCPVLSSTAGSLPEVAGDAALFFSPDDETQLANLLLQTSDVASMDDLRRRGRDRLANFSFTQCAAATAVTMNSLAETLR